MLKSHDPRRIAALPTRATLTALTTLTALAVIAGLPAFLLVPAPSASAASDQVALDFAITIQKDDTVDMTFVGRQTDLDPDDCTTTSLEKQLDNSPAEIQATADVGAGTCTATFKGLTFEDFEDLFSNSTITHNSSRDEFFLTMDSK